MIFRNLNSNNDWTFGKGKNNFVSKNDAIRLDIKTRLQSWVNNCFFDLSAGIDWNNRLGSKNQQTLLEADLRRVILQSDGVTGINSASTSLINRVFTANYDVSTIYSKSFRDSVTLGGPSNA